MVALIMILIVSLVSLFAIKYVNNNFDMMSSILGQILSKKEGIEFSDTQDTRKSKLVHQSKKIIKMVQLNDKAASKEKRVIKQLIGDIAHQVKTPFANIKMYTELLENEDLCKKEIANYVGEIKNQNEKLEWMIQSLLKTSRLESGAVEFNPEPLFIKQTIADSVSTIYALAQEKQIELIVETFDDLILSHNRKWTVEVINNVLENAIKYSSEKSEIIIGIKKMDIYTKINIKDMGIGIIKEDYGLIFNRFYRGQNVKDYKGAGIGLCLCRSIMAKQGGYITVKSELNKGSIFSICLRNTN